MIDAIEDLVYCMLRDAVDGVPPVIRYNEARCYGHSCLCQGMHTVKILFEDRRLASSPECNVKASIAQDGQGFRHKYDGDPLL